jgi:hypothetical protein
MQLILSASSPFCALLRIVVRPSDGAAIIDQTNQTNLDGHADRVVKGDRTVAALLERGQSGESVHEPEPGGSILSLV